jgi:hypothetical protein
MVSRYLVETTFGIEQAFVGLIVALIMHTKAGELIGMVYCFSLFSHSFINMILQCDV